MTSDSLQQKLKDLQFKVNTTPRWLGRFIYESMLADVLFEINESETAHLRLDLCFEHRQESYRSHYGHNNCDYCKAMKGDTSKKLPPSRYSGE